MQLCNTPGNKDIYSRMRIIWQRLPYFDTSQCINMRFQHRFPYIYSKMHLAYRLSKTTVRTTNSANVE